MANLYKAKLHADFTVCGVPDPAIRAYALIILKKRPQDGRMIDIMEMATKMASRTQAEGAGVTLNCRYGSVATIKRLCITWNCRYQVAL
jgi:hypothetical protein